LSFCFKYFSSFLPRPKARIFRVPVGSLSSCRCSLSVPVPPVTLMFLTFVNSGSAPRKPQSRASRSFSQMDNVGTLLVCLSPLGCADNPRPRFWPFPFEHFQVLFHFFAPLFLSQRTAQSLFFPPHDPDKPGGCDFYPPLLSVSFLSIFFSLCLFEHLVLFSPPN